MLKLNKKLHIYLLGGLISLLLAVVLLIPSQALALSPAVNQVKTPNNSAVYYLNHATHQRKAYINAAVFLDYGNNWSQVKVISPEELAQWPEARLIKTANSDQLYYINEGKKVLMRDLQDILNYHLEDVLPITVSEFELMQYQTETSYAETGLSKSNGLIVSQDLNLDQANPGYSLVPNTRDNQVMTLYLSARTETVTLNSLSFQISGLYNNDLIDEVYLVNKGNNKRIKSSSSFRDRIVTVRFNSNDFIITSGNTMAVRVMLSLNNASNVNNQTLQFKLIESGSVIANLNAEGSFPFLGRQFTLLDGNELLAKLVVNEESLGSNHSQQTLGRFVITETSGKEDVYIKELVFRNNGSANKFDLNNFKLKKDNQVIANASAIDSNLISFNIAYLRLAANSNVSLTVYGNLMTDYDSGRSVNLSLTDMTAVGKTYGQSLSSTINNISESFNLN
ncbi:MAG: hypothetical protein PHE20_00920 [Patescibacteria group bacterium]|nr:hypothetical protein [Patescibacteria group bacterium]